MKTKSGLLKMNLHSVAMISLGGLAGFSLSQALAGLSTQSPAISILKAPLEIQATSAASLAEGPFRLPPGTALQFERKLPGNTAIYGVRVEVRGDQLAVTHTAKAKAPPPLVSVNDPAIDERIPTRSSGH